jgi:hypothetical protein
MIIIWEVVLHHNTANTLWPKEKSSGGIKYWNLHRIVKLKYMKNLLQ